MLSYQSVQVEQVPQVQVQSFQTQIPPEKTEKSEFSFIDLLRNEQKRDDKEQTPVSRTNDEQKTAVPDEKIAEKADDTAEITQKEHSPAEKPRVSQKETEEPRHESPLDEATIATISAEYAQLSAVQPPVSAELPAEEVAAQAVVLETEVVSVQPAVDSEQLAWLYAQEDQAAPVVLDEPLVLSDDVAEETPLFVPDETAFLVPEIDPDDAGLEQAQQAAVEQPALFLQTVTPPAADTAADDTFSDTADTKPAVKEAKPKPRLEITDLRTQKTETAVETETAVTKAQTKNGADFAFDPKSEPAVQMTMEMTGATNIDQNITAANTQASAANGSTFQSMLAASIQENAPEFVKAGNIVLRDGNQGAINLILRPESLGNVKISLSLSDKVITGQITVQSQEAYNAFKDSIDSLKAAFAQGGFEAQGFDLNFAGSQQFAQSRQNDWQNPEFAIRAGKTYGDFVVGESDAIVADYDVSDYGVNIVA